MSGDRLAWAGAGFAAALVHGALALAATQMPVATPPPQVEIEIEMLDLGGGLALQPSAVEAVMSGIAPQVMQQTAVETRQQPVAGHAAVVAAQAPAVQQAAPAGATTRAATTAALATTVAASPTTATPQAAAMQPIGAAAPITVHVAAPAASPVGAPAATAARPEPAAQQGIATTMRSAIAPGSMVTAATTPLPVANGVNAVAPAAAAATAASTALAAVQGVQAATNATTAVPPATMQAATQGSSVGPVAALAPVSQPTAAPIAPSSAPPDPAASEPGRFAEPEAVANLPDATGPVGLPVPTRTDLVELITDFSGNECFSASPVSTDAGGFSVESLAIAPDDNDRLHQAVLEAFGDQVSFQGSTITPEQCRALGFLGGAAGSVGEKVRLGVDARTIVSGSTLTGILEGTADRVVHLLIVDDDGNIQAANAYTETVGPDTRFEIPLVVTGAGSARAQILFSVVVDEMMQTAAKAVDVPADKFFDALEFELIVKGLEADLAVASFTVE